MQTMHSDTSETLIKSVSDSLNHDLPETGSLPVLVISGIDIQWIFIQADKQMN